MNSLVFSGHESFPCRQFWLRKGYDFVKNDGSFTGKDAIVSLGVGKNMVSSIRYWMRGFGLVDEDGKLTDVAHFLLAEDGRDAYLEDPATLWLLHYFLVTSGRASIFSLVFNEFRKERFEFTRTQLLAYLERKCAEADVAIAERTMGRDVDVFVRTYLRPTGRGRTPEDDFLSLLIDLDLLHVVNRPKADGGAVFRVESRDRQMLPSKVVLFAVLEQNAGMSISFSRLMAEPNNVGNVFALNRDGLQRHLEVIAETYPEVTFSDDAGIKELQFTRRPDPYAVLASHYNERVLTFS